MATNSRKVSAGPVSTGLSGNDSIVAIATANSITNNALVTVTNLFANSNVPHVTVGNNAVSTANLIIRSVPANVPLSSGSPGVQGHVVYDANFGYVCVATNSWKRFALSTF